MAGRPCEACRHPEREQLDAALVAGAPFRNVAACYGMSPTAVFRHRNGHLVEQVQAAVETRRAEQADDPPASAAPAATAPAEPLDVLAQLRAVNSATLTVLRDARASGDGRLVLLAVDRVQRQIELQAKLLGDLDERPQVNLAISPEWLAVRSTLIQVLEPYPGRTHGRSECPGGAGERVMLAADLAAGLDPVLLAERVGIRPDPWQAQVLRSAAPRIQLNASRQSGKSTTVALLCLHTALYTAGSLCLMLSPTLRQSGELFKKATSIYRDLGRPVAAESETALTLTLENGSRIVSLPGQEGTVRGFSGVRLLAIDEASRVSTDLYMAVRPMLAVSGGRLVTLSTPFGTRGWWYEAWRSDQPWERYEVPAEQCPRITPAFLAEERASMGDWWFQQEYGCVFLDAQSAAFTRADVDAMFDEEVEVWPLLS